MSDELKTRDRALHTRKALRLLQETCHASGLAITSISNIDVMNTRPGKRLTIRYAVEVTAPDRKRQTRFIYGKLYRKRTGERTRDKLLLLAQKSLGAITLPTMLGYCPRRRFLVLDGILGAPMAELLALTRSHWMLADFGKALAQFHGILLSPEAIPHHDGVAESAVLRLAHERIVKSPLSHQIRHRFIEIVSHVQRDLKAPGSLNRQLLHRDLYPQQVIVQSDRFGLVDLDETSLGERELDLGNFSAHLILADLQKRGVIGSAHQLARSLRRSYQQWARLSPLRLRLYTAASLLRLASLERLSAPERSCLAWPQLARALVHEAEWVYSDGHTHHPSPNHLRGQTGGYGPSYGP